MTRTNRQRYAHANDAIGSSDGARLDRIRHLTGRNIVTVDMDATLYDPWACCGRRAGFSSSPGCTHLRPDILQRVLDTCRYYDAVPVVLSWRAGLVDTTLRWLRECGIAYAADPQAIDPAILTFDAVFIPGSADDIADLSIKRTTQGHVDHVANRRQFGSGQVAFKVGTIDALTTHLGCTVVASFDDNKAVVDAARAYGVLEPVQAPHLVTIEPWEWAAGYLGAPKPNYSRPAHPTRAPLDGVPATTGAAALSPALGEYVRLDLGSGLTELIVHEFDNDDIVLRETTTGTLHWYSPEELAASGS